MSLLKPKRLIASTDGIELAYWVHRANNSSDRFALLIHGGASNHTRWSEYVEHTALTKDWNVIVPDMRGNSESMTRANLNITTWLSDLLDVLAAEQARSTLIFGHSLGAQLAVQFAHKYPDKANGLVLIDPTLQHQLQGRSLQVRRCRWIVRGCVVLTLLLNHLGLRRRNFPIRDLYELDKETRIAIRDADSFDEIAKRYSAIIPVLKTMPVANYLRQALAMVSPLPALEELTLPVLAILSGGSTLGDASLNQQAVDRIANSETSVLNANHWPLTETPDQLRQVIDAWVCKNFHEVVEVI
jgi:pimeloyl-ACP methyl ester carboxylesterase